MQKVVSEISIREVSLFLGDRIKEIRSEQEKRYANNFMAKAIGMNRETLRLKLIGDRELYTYELEKIAKLFNVSVDRILGTDLQQKYRFLYNFMKNNPLITVSLAQELVRDAVGRTERLFAMFNLTTCYYLNSNYNEVSTCFFDIQKIVGNDEHAEYLGHYYKEFVSSLFAGNLNFYQVALDISTLK